MMQNQTRSQLHQTEERIPNEWWQSAHSGREVQVRLSPRNCVVPDLKRTIALQLAYDAVGR